MEKDTRVVSYKQRCTAHPTNRHVFKLQDYTYLKVTATRISNRSNFALGNDHFRMAQRRKYGVAQSWQNTADDLAPFTKATIVAQSTG